MKRILLLLFLLISTFGFSQVGVNTTNPDPSSMLDISATNKGVLVPRVSLPNVTTTQLDGTNTAATGLLIWNTNASTTGGNGVGFYFFNGSIWIPLTQAATSDHDWYEVGTTTAPNAITDRMFHTGSVAIGKNTITADNPKLSIEESGTGSIFPLTIFNIKDTSTGTNPHRGMTIDMEATSATNEYGITVSHNNPNAPLKYGVESIVQNGSGTNSAFEGRVSGTGLNSGSSILIQNSGSPSSGTQTGFFAGFEQATTAFTRGLYNQFLSNNSASDTGSKYGIYNDFGSPSRNIGGELFGSYNTFEPTLTSATNKYGSYTTIPSTVGGTHYGIYADVTKGNSFAGYFLGRMSIGTTAFNNYILPPSRGTNGQVMQTDGTGNVSWVTPTSATDSDWFELNSTNPANAITDNIYTQGRVSVGSSTLSNGKFNIYNSADTNSLYAENTFSPAGNTYTAYLTNSGTGAFQRYGLFTDVSGGGSGMRYGIYNYNNSTSTGNQGGVFNFLTGSGGDFIYGVRNYSTATGSGAQQQFGVFNDFSTVSDSQIMGVYNINTSNGNGTHYGTHNRILGNGNGLKYGTYNFIIGTGTGMRYGNYNYISGNGTNNKYGTYNLIDPLAAGTHYGLYSEALKTGSYAGYFLGNVSIGTTGLDTYIFPASRGTNGQIMQTDGSGNVSWVTPTVVTDTDDQTTDVFSLTGTTLNLSLQNDGVATQTVDLSSLKDADWYEVGGTNSPDAITDNKFTLGDISIGKITAANGKLDVDAATKTITASFTNTTTSAGSKWGIQNNVTVDPTNNFSYGISNSISGNANFKYGILNSLAGTVTGSAIEYGLVNSHLSGGAVDSFGVFNSFNPSSVHSGFYYGMYNQVSVPNHTGGFIGVSNIAGHTTNNVVCGISNSLGGSGSGPRKAVINTLTGTSTNDVTGIDTEILASGTGDKYGERILISNISGGTHYGVYSEVTKANSYAGYFLGNVSVGTTTANNYILPASRGTNGQTMQTDAAGNISWVNPPTDTDDQGTDVFSLTGNTLNLSLQNDGVATQTVDLSSLRDHDWYEVGTTNSPNAITDAIYHSGDVAIGKNTADYALDIFENDSSKLYAAVINKTDNNGAQTAGLAIIKATNSSGIGSNINNTISSTNAFSETSGIQNYFSGNGNLYNAGMRNEFNVRSEYQYGVENLFDDVNGAQCGMLNRFGNITGANASVGVQNGWTATNTVNSDCIGLSNIMSSGGTGDRIGVSNSISGSGTGTKFGVFNNIDATAGGIHYGIYSVVRKSNSYSGYFQGRVAIGTLPSDSYIMPLIRGTNGQIMQTDGVGNVSWVTPPADSDDQIIDVLSLTGDTLNLSIQNDGLATQTLNLAAIDNQASDVFSLTGTTLNLSLQNDGVATQTVDLSSLSNDWKLTGNAGTLSGTNFIGTTDAQDLDFRVNNVVKIRLTQQGQLSFVNAGGSVFVGINAGDADDLTSNQNTFVGATSGQFTSTGNLNTAIGHASLNANLTGQGNSGLGKSSLLTNTTGSNNTGLGRLADVATSGLSNATAVGYNATVSVSDKVRLGSATVTVVEGQVPYTNPSDARFKFNVQENVPGLDFIKKLKPVTYNFDTKKFDEHLNQKRNKDEVATEDFSKSTAIIRTGFLAQDVEKICTDLGYNFDGLHVPDANNPTDNYGIAYSQFIMPIVKAVQEQQVIIETQKTELEQLKSELEKYKTLEERIKALEQK